MECQQATTDPNDFSDSKWKNSFYIYALNLFSINISIRYEVCRYSLFSITISWKCLLFPHWNGWFPCWLISGFLILFHWSIMASACYLAYYSSVESFELRTTILPTYSFSSSFWLFWVLALPYEFKAGTCYVWLKWWLEFGQRLHEIYTSIWGVCHL